jgi:DNA-3-methyladenine glycosylase II
MKSKTGNRAAISPQENEVRSHFSLSDSTLVEAGVSHLRAADPAMRELIDRVGPFALSLERRRFYMLVRSIISQQISTGAARSITRRLQRALSPGMITAEKLARLSIAELRAAGISPQKAGYLQDLAGKVISGGVCLRRLRSLPDATVIDTLIQIKGIGRWTAQMFLIFSLGRPDVFPHDDLGIRVAIRNLYHLKELPDQNTSQRIARPWRPYATIASWYCWRSLDQAKAVR